MKKPETMGPTYRIYPEIAFGARAVIGDYVVVVVPPRGRELGEMTTTLGAGNVTGDNFQTGHGALGRGGSVISGKARG